MEYYARFLRASGPSVVSALDGLITQNLPLAVKTFVDFFRLRVAVAKLYGTVDSQAYGAWVLAKLPAGVVPIVRYLRYETENNGVESLKMTV